MNTSSTPSGLAAIVGGLGIVALGITASVNESLAGSGWFLGGAVAAALITAALLGLHRALSELRVARIALIVSAIAMGLFSAAHVYAAFDPDRAIPLFTAFMMISSLATVVAGVSIIRHDTWTGWRRVVPLLCGVWPVATIPPGAAIGGLAHFGAIAVWGLCWIVLGSAMITAPARVKQVQPV